MTTEEAPDVLPPPDPEQLWVVYQDPDDYPAPVAVRRWWALPEGEDLLPDVLAHGFNTVHAAREWILINKADALRIAGDLAATPDKGTEVWA